MRVAMLDQMGPEMETPVLREDGRARRGRALTHAVSVRAGLTSERVIGRGEPERDMRASAGDCHARPYCERDIEEKHRFVHIIFKGSIVVGSSSHPLGGRVPPVRQRRASPPTTG